jgi:osmotically-inducible protein OsmY
MANRYNDQDYPRYYDRDDRDDNRPERNRPPRGGRREPEDFNRERQGYYGMSYDREPENRSQDSSRSEFGRSNRSDREDYTLYGYDPESRQGTREQNRRIGENEENRQSNQSSSGRQQNFQNRDRDNFDERRSFYGQGGGQIGSERGYTHENRGGEDERGWWDRTSDQFSSWFGDEDAQRRLQRDERESNYGQHRGRGPKNYRRTDSRIEEDLNDRLTVHAYLDASDIEVSVKDGEAILTGTVESRYAKRMAEDIADDTAGVNHVENRLRVRQQSVKQTQSQSSTSVSIGDTGPMTGGSASGGETGASLAASGGASPTTSLTGDQRAATHGANASALNIENDDSFDERGVDRLSNPKTS